MPDSWYGDVSDRNQAFQTLIMDLFLCLDAGNSRQKLAVFHGERMMYFQVEKEFSIEQLTKVLDRFPVSAAMLCEVKSLNKPIKNFLRKKVRLLEMSHRLRLPVRNEYRTPETLGKDRLAAAAGAVRLYPGEAVLIIGLGTCITYDFVSGRGVYRGGAISPGLDMRFRAMHDFTEKLPLVKFDPKAALLGNSTTTALQAGAVWGMTLELQGMIERYRKKYKNLKVILAGGGADFFKKRLKKPIFAHPNLVLLGLNEVLSLNVLET